MSTKIYSGLRLADPETSIYDAVKTVSRAIRASFAVVRLPLVAEQIVRIVDEGERGPENRLVFDDAEAQWLREQNEIGTHHALNDPLRFSICFGEASDGRVLAVPFHMNAEYDKALAATGLFEEYGYWNNSDRPENLSNDQWRKRREDWDSVLDPDDTFGHLPHWELVSLRETFSFEILFDETKTVDAYIEPRQRLRRLLANALMNSRDQTAGWSVFRAATADARTARTYVDALPDDSPLLPAPIGSFRVKYGDLPEPIALSEDVIAAARQLSDSPEEES
ncbi:hypothetical protein ACFVU2_19470 [Leifsonia sp. NPDC058194]|uniref:hypothetical protein n=1 Tax=Leifsonia sp. NPDC058194 TaxID=3346374 RepID=UPI0036DB58D3